jgi:dihydroorotase
MPNLVPPVATLEDVIAYKDRVLAAVPNDYFEPYMTIFYKNYDKAFLESVRDEITAVKLYPAGITTNSEGGVSSFDIEEMRKVLSKTHGIIIQDSPEINLYPMPITAEDRDETFVGRIRLDESATNSVNLWIVADNLRKGAATNSVQIAEYLIEKKFV